MTSKTHEVGAAAHCTRYCPPPGRRGIYDCCLFSCSLILHDDMMKFSVNKEAKFSHALSFLSFTVTLANHWHLRAYVCVLLFHVCSTLKRFWLTGFKLSQMVTFIILRWSLKWWLGIRGWLTRLSKLGRKMIFYIILVRKSGLYSM